MAYSTNTTILTLLPGMPQTSTSNGYTATTTLIDEHINRADNVINAKIAQRYAVGSFNTSGSVPPLLKTISEDIASYFTFRSEFGGDNQNDNEWTDKFKDAIELLDQLREGDIDLVNTTGSIIDERTTSAVDIISSTHIDYQPFFDEDSVTSWKVDDDKISSIEDNR